LISLRHKYLSYPDPNTKLYLFHFCHNRLDWNE
jgi:hypothetical protein